MFSELCPQQGPEMYIPKLYGFRMFSLKGSKYELKFTSSGDALNEKEVLHILQNKLSNGLTQ